MALKYKLDTLEGLEEAQKALYKPGPDGKGFVLDMDDDPAKETMRKLRDQISELERALKARDQKEADERSAREREDLEKRGDYEKASAGYQKRIKELEEALGAQATSIHRERIGRAAVEALAKHGGIPKALQRHLEDALEHVADGDGYKVVVKGDPAMTPEALVTKWKADPEWAFGFNGSGASGSGAQPGGGTGGGTKAWKDMTLDEQTDLYRTNPAQAKALQGA